MLTTERKRKRTRRLPDIHSNKITSLYTQHRIDKGWDRKFRGWQPNKSAFTSLGIKKTFSWAEHYYYLKLNPYKSEDKAFVVLNDLLETNPDVSKLGLSQNLGVHRTIIWMLNNSIERWIELIKKDLDLSLFNQPAVILTKVENNKYSIKLGINYQCLSPLGLPLIKTGNKTTSPEEAEILRKASSVFGIPSEHRSIEMELENLDENSGEYFLDGEDEKGLEEYKSIIVEIASELNSVILRNGLGDKAFNEDSPKELVEIYQKMKELEDIETNDAEYIDLDPYFGSYICDESMFFYKEEDDEVFHLIANDFDCMYNSDLFIPPVIFEPLEIAEKTFPLRTEIFDKLANYYYG